MRSTAASVWPPRSRTPPSTARSGRMWPGRMSCSGVDAGSASTRSVCARSAALMPVDVRSAASTEIVYAVPRTSSLRSVMSGSSSRSAIAFVIGAQRKPLVWRTIHAIHSWVANSAAMIASPSFSRASSSATMTGLPARRASSTSGIVARLMRDSLLRPRPVLRVTRAANGARRSAASARRGGRGCRSRCSRGRRRSRRPSVVAVSVSGMSDTSNHEPSGSSPSALTVSETPSTAIEPLSTTSGACASSSEKRMTRQASPGRISSTRAVPSMCPCTMWPPRRSPTRAARSRFTSRPSAAPSSVDIASVCAMTSAVKRLRRRSRRR